MDKFPGNVTSPYIIRNMSVSNISPPLYRTDHKNFVKELKFCTQDPARYLQRCISVSARISNKLADTVVIPSKTTELKYLRNEGQSRKLLISKSSFLEESPDQAVIANMISSFSPDDFYNSPRCSRYLSSSCKGNDNTDSSYITNQLAKIKNAEISDKSIYNNPQDSLISEKKTTSLYKKLKKRTRKKKVHSKNKLPFSNPKHLKNEGHSTKIKNGLNVSRNAKKKTTVSDIPSKFIQKLSNNALFQTSQRCYAKHKKNCMVNRILEETQHMLRITFLSDFRCSCNAPTTQLPDGEFSTKSVSQLEKSDFFRLLNYAILKGLSGIKNVPFENKEQFWDDMLKSFGTVSTCANTEITAMLPKLNERTMRGGMSNCQSTQVYISNPRDPSIENRRSQVSQSQEKVVKRNSKSRQKASDQFILGRPGKDDVEEAELTHCIVAPDPPSAISKPYGELCSNIQSSNEETTLKEETHNSDVKNRKICLEPPETALLPTQNNPNNTELYQSVHKTAGDGRHIAVETHINEDISNIANKDKTFGNNSFSSPRKELPENGQEEAIASGKKFMKKQRGVFSQRCIKENHTKTNVSEATNETSLKRIPKVKKLSSEMVVSGKENYLRCFSVESQVFEKCVPTKIKSRPLNYSKRLIGKHGIKRKNNSVTLHANIRRYTPSTDPPGSSSCLVERQEKENARISAVFNAENRYYNKTEHLMSLARPPTRYVTETKQRYKTILDPYHMRNLDTILFCNHVEQQRLKQLRQSPYLVKSVCTRIARNTTSEDSSTQKGISPAISEESPKHLNISESSLFNKYNTTLNTDEVEDPDYLRTNNDECTFSLEILDLGKAVGLKDINSLYLSLSEKVNGHINTSGELLPFNNSSLASFEDTTEIVHSASTEKEFNEVSISSNPEPSDNMIQLNCTERNRVQGTTNIREQVPKDLYVSNDKLEVSLENPEQQKCAAKSLSCATQKSNVGLSLQPLESLPAEIPAFTTIYEGMDSVLRHMQALLLLNISNISNVQCGFITLGELTSCNKTTEDVTLISDITSVYSDNYIQHKEIEADCSQALLVVKKTKIVDKKETEQHRDSFYQKYLSKNECMHSEIYLISCTRQLPITMKSSIDKIHYSTKQLAVVGGTESIILNKPSSVCFNFTPCVMKPTRLIDSVMFGLKCLRRYFCCNNLRQKNLDVKKLGYNYIIDSNTKLLLSLIISENLKGNLQYIESFISKNNCKDSKFPDQKIIFNMIDRTTCNPEMCIKRTADVMSTLCDPFARATPKTHFGNSYSCANEEYPISLPLVSTKYFYFPINYTEQILEPSCWLQSNKKDKLSLISQGCKNVSYIQICGTSCFDPIMADITHWLQKRCTKDFYTLHMDNPNNCENTIVKCNTEAERMFCFLNTVSRESTNTFTSNATRLFTHSRNQKNINNFKRERLSIRNIKSARDVRFSEHQKYIPIVLASSSEVHSNIPVFSTEVANSVEVALRDSSRLSSHQEMIFFNYASTLTNLVPKLNVSSSNRFKNTNVRLTCFSKHIPERKDCVPTLESACRVNENEHCVSERETCSVCNGLRVINTMHHFFRYEHHRLTIKCIRLVCTSLISIIFTKLVAQYIRP